MRFILLLLLLLQVCLMLIIMIICLTKAEEMEKGVILDVKGGPESVIWILQLSDLHFSVHHPDRALDFNSIVGPTLSMINPSLVLITGDLTDGKSKDLLVMKQNEEEWIEYQNTMEDVVKRSGLDKTIFYDLRGNHDNLGVPSVGGSFDFFSKYSINGQLGRSRHVNSITLQTGEQKHLFVGLDSTMPVGLRGPTNLFGHPTDELLSEIDSELSQWDDQPTKPATKISFGHFPLSFSASTNSGRSLKDIFLKHSVSAYLCGHLHTRFGKNLKRHHQSTHRVLPSNKFFQLNMHGKLDGTSKNCSSRAPVFEEFWEWETGDWRKSRAIRILAIDRGHVSFLDIDFKSGAKKTIIVPTFPLDSRLMSSSSSNYIYNCERNIRSSHGTVRALVFSTLPIMSVVARVYDSTSEKFDIVMEASMVKLTDYGSRGDLYAAPWNYKAFEDPSPERYWLQIESTDAVGRLTTTELRPFSINGLRASLSWSWKEFFVMGCQWAALYYPILWSALSFLLLSLLIPKFTAFSKKQYTYKKFLGNKGVVNFVAWALQELNKIPVVWYSMLGYLFSLVLIPWFVGQVYTEEGERQYMTYMGWAVKGIKKHEYIGSPDVMVIVLPHVLFVLLPAFMVSVGLAAERGVFKNRVMSTSGKKVDDYQGSAKRQFKFGDRQIRKILLLACFAICWKHFTSCRVLMKAYDMNPVLHFPVYSLTIPLLLAYTFCKTKRF